VQVRGECGSNRAARCGTSKSPQLPPPTWRLWWRRWRPELKRRRCCRCCHRPRHSRHRRLLAATAVSAASAAATVDHLAPPPPRADAVVARCPCHEAAVAAREFAPRPPATGKIVGFLPAASCKGRHCGPQPASKRWDVQQDLCRRHVCVCTGEFQKFTIGWAIPPRNQVNQSTPGIGKVASRGFLLRSTSYLVE